MPDANPTAPRFPTRVHGTLKDAHDSPVPNITIQVWRVGISGRSLLASKPTGSDGTWTIQLVRHEQPPVDAPALDVVIEACDPKGTVIAESGLIIAYDDAEPVRLVSRISAPRIPEAKRNRDQLKPVLNDTDLAEVGSSSLAYIAAKSGVPRTQLDELRLAARLAKDSGIPRAAADALVVRGFRMGPGELTRHGPDAWKEALHDALAKKELDDIAEADIADIAGTLISRAATLVLTRENTPTGGTLTPRLEVAGFDADERKHLAQAFLTSARAEDPWAAFKNASGLDDDGVSRLRFTLEVDELLNGHLPLLRAIRGRMPQANDARALAAFDAKAWTRLIRDEQVELPSWVPGEDDATKLIAYSTRLDSTGPSRASIPLRIWLIGSILTACPAPSTSSGCS
jgi:hypothetical protein